MVHFIFLLKTNITKFISQFFDLRNWRYDFCKNAKNLDLNKREERTVESLTAGPARQRPREQGTPSPANLADGELLGLIHGSMT